MRPAQPLLVVVLGLPGTGKTTFARALGARLEAAHFNTDKLRTELGLRGQYDEAAKARIYGELLERCRTGLAQGNPVILDGTFYLQAFRDRLAELALTSQARTKWIEILASPQTVEQRVSQERPFSEADFAVYQKIRGAFEPLQGERLQLFSDRQPLEAMLGLALEYVKS